MLRDTSLVNQSRENPSGPRSEKLQLQKNQPASQPTGRLQKLIKTIGSLFKWAVNGLYCVIVIPLTAMLATLALMTTVLVFTFIAIPIIILESMMEP